MKITIVFFFSFFVATSYDMFLLLKGFQDPRVTKSFFIAKNTEKFKFAIINDFFHFMDSFYFLNFSLDKLVQDHKTRHSDFPILKQSMICEDEDGDFSESRYDILLKGKSVIPYEKITVSLVS